MMLEVAPRGSLRGRCAELSRSSYHPARIFYQTITSCITSSNHDLGCCQHYTSNSSTDMHCFISSPSLLLWLPFSAKCCVLQSRLFSSVAMHYHCQRHAIDFEVWGGLMNASSNSNTSLLAILLSIICFLLDLQPLPRSCRSRRRGKSLPPPSPLWYPRIYPPCP